MFFSKLITASSIDRASPEDLCSQLNHIWSVMLLVTIGVLITMVQYVGDPIQCWCPAQMPEAHCNYTKALCWIKANYYFDTEEPIPQKEEDRWETTVAYYPWVPWILFAMAAVLKLPHLMWNSFMPSSGLNLSKLISMADEDDSPEDLAKIIRIWLVRYGRAKKSIFNSTRRVLGSMGLFWLGRHEMTYITGLVIWVKVWFLLASIGLFFSLNIFLQVNFMTYGYDVIANLIRGIPLSMKVFPKNTICDIKIRQMNNVHTYSIQCILPINMYNQYIFIFLWYYFIILTFANFYSLGKWALNLLSEANRVKFVEGYARTIYCLANNGKKNGLPTDSPVVNGAMNDTNNNSNNDNNNDGNKPIARRLASRLDSTMSTGSTIRHDPSLPDKHLPPEKESDRQIRRIVSRMIRHFGHDGVVLFRTLEAAVGTIIANNIFQELYNQIAQSSNTEHTL